METLTNFDANILFYIQNHLRNAYLNYFMVHFTSLGNAGKIWIIITILMLIYPKTRRVGVCSAISMILCFITGNLLIKNIVARTRPYITYDNIRCLVEPEKDYSFPSAHTAMAFTATLPIFLKYDKTVGGFALAVAVLMGLSRLYVCVHYPSDVICGALLGLVCALISCKLIYPWICRRAGIEE